MRIRAVEERDIHAWAQMRHALWPDAGAEELAQECTAFFAGPTLIDAAFVAADENDALVGFIELSLRSHAEGCSASPVPYVEGWYVASIARRNGVGRALIEAAEDWALRLGHAEIASDAQLDNCVSADAHAALGFAVVKRTIHFRKALR